MYLYILKARRLTLWHVQFLGYTQEYWRSNSKSGIMNAGRPAC